MKIAYLWLALIVVALGSFGGCGGTSDAGDTSGASAGSGASVDAGNGGGSSVGSGGKIGNSGGKSSSSGTSGAGQGTMGGEPGSAAAGEAGTANGGSANGGAAGDSAGGAPSDRCGGCDRNALQICIFQQGGPGPSHFTCAKQNLCGAVGACACIVDQGTCGLEVMGGAPSYCVCNNGLK